MIVCYQRLHHKSRGQRAILCLVYEETVVPYEDREMKSSARIIMLVALAASCVSTKLASAAARPVVGGLFSSSLFDAKTAVGKDGLFRMLWDYNPARSGSSTYSGSALWILDPNGSVVAAGSSLIPASIGSSFLTATIQGRTVFRAEVSNTALFAQNDGNTTVLFYYGLVSGSTTTFGVWTFNSSGSLISGAGYGPYSGITISAMYFDPSGKIIVRWTANSLTRATWVLDEFGGVVSATSFYGPFASILGKVRLNSSGQQVWPFSILQSDGTYKLSIWTFNASGSAIVNVQSYGPF
jgi:hypothetical protein